MKKYTHEPIPGRLPGTLLPDGWALVCEGGGTRGFYSAGVYDAFLEADLMFPYIIGVSAGTANTLSYVSGQKGRNRQVVEHYVGSPRYVSKRNLLFHGSMFNMEYVFHTIPREHLFFDWEAFRRCPARFLIGAMNCADGQNIWFEKEQLREDLTQVIASCSVPLLSPMVKLNGLELLDGGVPDPIPIEKSIADGNTFHVVVLTRNPGYVKKPFGMKGLLEVVNRKHPAVARALLTRHERYNRQLALCEQLEREGKAIIIRPLKPLQIDRTGSDTAKLLALYDEGTEEGRAALRRLNERLKIGG